MVILLGGRRGYYRMAGQTGLLYSLIHARRVKLACLKESMSFDAKYIYSADRSRDLSRSFPGVPIEISALGLWLSMGSRQAERNNIIARWQGRVEVPLSGVTKFIHSLSLCLMQMPKYRGTGIPPHTRCCHVLQLRVVLARAVLEFCHIYNIETIQGGFYVPWFYNLL